MLIVQAHKICWKKLDEHPGTISHMMLTTMMLLLEIWTVWSLRLCYIVLASSRETQYRQYRQQFHTGDADHHDVTVILAHFSTCAEKSLNLVLFEVIVLHVKLFQVFFLVWLQSCKNRKPEFEAMLHNSSRSSVWLHLYTSSLYSGMRILTHT